MSDRKLVRHGIARGPSDLHLVMRKLAERRNMPRRQIDKLADFTAGYSEKLLALVPQRAFTLDSLFSLLAAQGARMVIEDDPETLRRIADFLNGRKKQFSRASVVGTAVLTAKMLEKQAIEQAHKMRCEQTRRARQIRDQKLTPEQRSASARHAANTRHKRERAARKAARNAPSQTLPPIVPQNLSTTHVMTETLVPQQIPQSALAGCKT